MKLRTLIFLALAIACYFVSHSLELRGDAAPMVENGVSPERAKYHVMALLLLVGAIGFFIAAGWSVFRSKRK